MIIHVALNTYGVIIEFNEYDITLILCTNIANKYY